MKIPGTVAIAFCALVWAGVMIYREKLAAPALLKHIAVGNVRIEADEIDIAAKFAGRVDAVFVDEGDLVTEGQILVQLHSRELKAQVRALEAESRRKERLVSEADAEVKRRVAEFVLTKNELDRAVSMSADCCATVKLVDSR